MNDTVIPEINIDDLMRRIREEVSRRKAQATAPSTPAAGAPASVPSPAPDATTTLPPCSFPAISLPRQPEGGGTLALKSEYALADFLDFHDEDFVRNAYCGILRREPDTGGYAYYLNMLRTGQFTKAEILGASALLAGKKSIGRPRPWAASPLRVAKCLPRSRAWLWCSTGQFHRPLAGNRQEPGKV